MLRPSAPELVNAYRCNEGPNLSLKIKGYCYESISLKESSLLSDTDGFLYTGILSYHSCELSFIK